MTQVTGTQLVALAERLGWDNSNSYWRHPELLRLWEGAGAIQAAMAGLGYTRWSCDFYAQSSPPYTAAFWKSGQDNYKESEAGTAPDAIALAACAALGVTG